MRSGSKPGRLKEDEVGREMRSGDKMGRMMKMKQGGSREEVEKKMKSGDKPEK